MIGVLRKKKVPLETLQVLTERLTLAIMIESIRGKRDFLRNRQFNLMVSPISGQGSTEALPAAGSPAQAAQPPTAPAKPTEQAKLTEPAKPTEQAKPTEPAKPTGPAKPAEPVPAQVTQMARNMFDADDDEESA